MINPAEHNTAVADFASLALHVEDALFAADLKPSELRAARLIVKLSLGMGRTTTPQLLQKDFGLLAGLRESHIAETLGWLLGKKIIVLERAASRSGMGVYRPNTTIESWLVDSRVSEEARAREAELLSEAQQPEFWHQATLRAGDHSVALADAEVAVAAAASRCGSNLRNSEGATSENRKSGTSEIRKSSRVARTRERATCMSGSSTKSMACMHGVHAPSGEGEKQKPELQDKHYDLLDQIEELTSTEPNASDFRKTWERRVVEDEIATFKTIAQVKVDKREGKIRRSVGGALNFYFTLFSKGARGLARRMHLL